MSLWLPTSVKAAELNAARERFVEEQIAHAQRWNRELQKLDRYLSLVFISDQANEPGLVPGRWHIRRKPPTGVAWYWPIVREDGGYREMTSSDLDALRASDLQNSMVIRDRKKFDEKVKEAKRRARKLEREQLQDNFVEDLRAAQRVAGDGGLTKRRFLAW